VKRTLEFEDEFDFSLVGIGCHAKDYRLSWEINNSLNIKLKKEEDIYPETGQDEISFDSSAYYDIENHLQYTLISNKKDGVHLIPEHPQLDYFLKVIGPQHDCEIEHQKQIIQGIDLVLTALLINPKTLKSKPNLVF